MNPCFVRTTGLVCPIGLTAPTACAAIRCDINVVEELDFEDERGEPYYASMMPDLEPGLSGRERVLALLARTLNQAVAPARYGGPVAVFVVLPTSFADAEKQAYRQLIKDAMARPGCTCTGETKVLPNPPCDVFYGRQPDGSTEREEQMDNIKAAWDALRPRFQLQQGLPAPDIHRPRLERQLGRPVSNFEFNQARKTNHLTPKTAGGCPTGKGNLQSNAKLCQACQAIDGRFNRFQT